MTLVFLVTVGFYTATAAVLDVRLHRIPNYLTAPAAVAGLAYHSWLGDGWWVALSGFAVGFALLLLPWILGGGGMGDVKLLGALGAWLGPKLILIAFAVSVFTASVLALGVLTYHAATKGLSKTKKTYLSRNQAASGGLPRRRMRVLPFAVPVAMSTWAVLAWLALRGG